MQSITFFRHFPSFSQSAETPFYCYCPLCTNGRQTDEEEERERKGKEGRRRRRRRKGKKRETICHVLLCALPRSPFPIFVVTSIISPKFPGSNLLFKQNPYKQPKNLHVCIAITDVKQISLNDYAVFMQEIVENGMHISYMYIVQTVKVSKNPAAVFRCILFCENYAVALFVRGFRFSYSVRVCVVCWEGGNTE